MQRHDGPLIRHIHRHYGDRCAREWQRPPLVVLPGADLIAYLSSPDGAELAKSADLEYLPWDDAVYDLGPLRESLGAQPRGYAWLRVRTLHRYLTVLDRSAPWMLGPDDLLEQWRDDHAELLVIEAWEDRTEVPGQSEPGLPNYPDVVLIRRDRPWAAYMYPNPTCRGDRVYGAGFCDAQHCRHRDLALPCAGSDTVMRLWSGLVPQLLAYISQSPMHPVEVRPKTAERQRRRRAPKPWTRTDLPHVILLDPLRMREYGHPSDSATHASPRPHQRRGHWRRLEHARFRTQRRVWIRPAWVGATEWEHHGATYKVLITPGEASKP